MINQFVLFSLVLWILPTSVMFLLIMYLTVHKKTQFMIRKIGILIPDTFDNHVLSICGGNPILSGLKTNAFWF